MKESSDVDVGLATDTAAFDASFRLVHDQYVWRGYLKPTASRRRLIAHHTLPTTRVFVASRSAEAVGTVTLVEDSLFGLPLDDLYRDEVSPLRAERRRIGEVCALATAPQCRRNGVTVLMHMMRMLVTYATELAALDDLCITVNPRHVEFYRSCLRFEIIGGERAYDTVNGAPAIALRLDLDIARQLAAAVQSGEDDEPVHHFFFASDNQAEALSKLRGSLPHARFRRSQFLEFCDGTLLERLSPSMRARLEGFYAPVRLDRPCETAIVRSAPSCPAPAEAVAGCVA